MMFGLLTAGLVLIGLTFADMVRHDRVLTNRGKPAPRRRHYWVGGLGFASLAAAWCLVIVSS